jgi:hypothetical protein
MAVDLADVMRGEVQRVIVVILHASWRPMGHPHRVTKLVTHQVLILKVP